MPERLYRILLHAYPSEFREEYGAQLRQMFRDRMRSEPRMRVWIHILADLIITAPVEHFDAFCQDARGAWRFFAANRGFAAIAVLTLGLGMGANTAVFTLLNGLLFAPMPVSDPDRVVTIMRGDHAQAPPVSYADYVDLRAHSRSFTDLALHSDILMVKLGRGAATEEISAELVSDNYFRVFDIRPGLGRVFRSDESRQQVIVLSAGLWARRFGSDPEILGRGIEINGAAFVVIGIAPANFHGALVPIETDAWIPVGVAARILPEPDAFLSDRSLETCAMSGRLGPGVSRRRAESELQAIDRQLAAQYPRPHNLRLNPEDRVLRVVKMEGVAVTFLRRRIEAAGGFLMAVVALVLLICCANVAHMLLARMAARRREMAVRLAIGARRRRLIRQLLTESMLLAAMGTLLAILIAAWAPRAIMHMIPNGDGYTRVINTGINQNVLLFAAAVAILTGVLFGIAPALEASRGEWISGLKDGYSGEGRGRRLRFRSLLVAGQIAISFVLLAAAALFLGSLARTEAIDPGFNTRSTFFLTIDTHEKRWAPAQQLAFLDQVRQRVAAVQGIDEATFASHVPFDIFSARAMQIRVVEHEQPDRIDYDAVAPGYFDAMQIPLRNGRAIEDRDHANSPPVAVINATMARKLFPGEDPLGRQLRRESGAPITIIGVAGDGKYRALTEDPLPHLYVPLAQVSDAADRVKLIVRTAGDPAPWIAPVLAQIQAIDPNLPILHVNTMSGYVRSNLGTQRGTVELLAIFGSLALALASLGIYGVVSHSVAQRTHEIGIRMAVGAGRGDVAWMILVESSGLALAGI
ncbi:MAG TPA: ABC transporter permease, partial [Bryobacteraceae bacterium]|nr:ABC transporter permease [Bryobacteraceae bacterium]